MGIVWEILKRQQAQKKDVPVTKPYEEWTPEQRALRRQEIRETIQRLRNELTTLERIEIGLPSSSAIDRIHQQFEQIKKERLDMYDVPLDALGLTDRVLRKLYNRYSYHTDTYTRTCGDLFRERAIMTGRGFGLKAAQEVIDAIKGYGGDTARLNFPDEA
jgi:hypothetical protein